MYYENDDVKEGRICLFDSHTNSVEQIAKFYNYYFVVAIATTKNRVNSYVRFFKQFHRFQIFGISGEKKSFEIYDLNTQQISRGLINKFIIIGSRILQVQLLLNGVMVHLLLISKTNCIIWVERILKQGNIRIA